MKKCDNLRGLTNVTLEFWIFSLPPQLDWKHHLVREEYTHVCSGIPQSGDCKLSQRYRSCHISLFSCPSRSIPTLLINYTFITLHNLWCRPYKTIPTTKFHNCDKISQFWANFTIFTRFHKFDKISQFWPSFTIFTRFHNFDQISQFWPDFTI